MKKSLALLSQLERVLFFCLSNVAGALNGGYPIEEAISTVVLVEPRLSFL